MRIESRAAFDALCAKAKKRSASHRKEVLVCCGTGCLANGSARVADAFAAELAQRGLDAKVGTFTKRTGCHGFCQRGPLVVIQPAGILYTQVKPKDVAEICEKTLSGGEVVPRLLYRNPANKQKVELYGEVPFYAHQTRIAMRNIGKIDPTDILDAIAHGAYAGLVKALAMTPEEVIAEVGRAGLRGRGGAGFPTSMKWELARKSPGMTKYMICITGRIANPVGSRSI
jgi:(2Fe-2S) ferredoxin